MVFFADFWSGFNLSKGFKQTNWVVLSVLLLLLFLVSQAPARLIAIALPANVSLEGYNGTLWQGRAARASVVLNGQQFQLGQLDWTLHPSTFLVLRPAVTVESQWGSQRFNGRIAVGLGGSISLQDSRASLDIEFTRQLIPLYIGGTVQVDIQHLELQGTTPASLEGRVVWQNAVWTARSGDVPLGNYALEISGTNALEGQVLTLSGPLSVSGSVNLADKDYRLDLQLRGPATENPGLKQSLALLAVPVAEGFDIQLEGSL